MNNKPPESTPPQNTPIMPQGDTAKGPKIDWNNEVQAFIGAEGVTEGDVMQKVQELYEASKVSNLNSLTPEELEIANNSEIWKRAINNEEAAQAALRPILRKMTSGGEGF